MPSFQYLMAGDAPTHGVSRAQIKTAASLPTPGPGEVVVRVAYASHNPPDAYPFVPESLALQYCRPDSHLGSDFSGVVVEVGERAAGALPPVGAEVFGWVPGNIAQYGAFAEYVVCDAALVFKKPSSVPLDQAAALSFSFSTALHALSSGLGLDVVPDAHKGQEPVLVWGGGTACGMYATQILALAGFRAVTVGGRQDLGADLVLPRSDVAAAVRTVREKYPTLRYALDCFGSQETSEACMRALGDAGGVVHALLPAKVLPELADKVRVQFALVHSMYGQALDVFKLQERYPTDEELKRDHDLALAWGSYDQGHLAGLLDQGRLKLAPVTLWPPAQAPQKGGLEGVQDALYSMALGLLGQTQEGVPPFPSGKVVHRLGGPSA